ncbi:MAG: response regulator [Nitrospirales bacterium]
MSSAQKMILLVDDDPCAVALFTTELREHGFRVLTAGHGSEAFYICQTQRGSIDLVLLDICLTSRLELAKNNLQESGLNGLQLGHRIRTVAPGLPILFISSLPHEEIQAFGGLPTGTSLLPKPFGMQALVQQVQGLLDAAPASDAFAPAGGARPVVLLVEDQESLLPLLEQFLPRHGFTVLTAHEPDEAFKVCRSYDGLIHVLVADLFLPDSGSEDSRGRLNPSMNGIELARCVGAVRPEARVVFVSGHSDGEIAKLGGLPEDAPFLRKPFELPVLLQTVQNLQPGFVRG